MLFRSMSCSSEGHTRLCLRDCTFTGDDEGEISRSFRAKASDGVPLKRFPEEDEAGGSEGGSSMPRIGGISEVGTGISKLVSCSEVSVSAGV